MACSKKKTNNKKKMRTIAISQGGRGYNVKLITGNVEPSYDLKVSNKKTFKTRKMAEKYARTLKRRYKDAVVERT